MTSETLQQRMRREMTEKRLFEQIESYAFTYMDQVTERSVFPNPSAIDKLSEFEESMPLHSDSAEHVLDLLHNYGSPATVAQTGGRYFGFVNGNSVPAGLAARWLADTWDQNAALQVMSPVAAKLEQVCEGWLRELLGLPEKTVAGFVGGTSVATMCGLAAARFSILDRLRWDVNAKGLFGAPPIRVVTSEQAHGSVYKALALIGIGRDSIELVPVDSEGRIDVASVPELDSQTLLILQAGNVNSGSFDDCETLCARARAAGAWVHVDGAFGLWAAASEQKKYLTRGIEKADSWSVDGHKTLNTPYDCGIVLCRHRDALLSALQASGSYLQFSDARDGMSYVPDMSRRARGVELWATLKYLGSRGVAELIDGLCARASQFAEGLRSQGFRILNNVVFNQVLVACDSSAETQAVVEHIQRSGVCWCGTTTWFGETAIRISVCSWSTTAEDVERSIEAFMAARSKLSTDSD